MSVFSQITSVLSHSFAQATLHEGILQMAGQLGLDPPTMNLCSGGPSAELEQALKNSEAVANCFKCSISTSAIAFVVYCSKRISSMEKHEIMEKHETFLKEMKFLTSWDGNMHKALDPIFLYILVPDLPKRYIIPLLSTWSFRFYWFGEECMHIFIHVSVHVVSLWYFAYGRFL